MRSPDQGGPQWCLGRAAPPEPCAQALGWQQCLLPFLEFSPSSAMASVCLPHPFSCPA